MAEGVYAVSVQALILGLSAGIFCLGYCSPPLAALLLTRPDGGIKRSFSLIGIFLGGRFAAYVLVGMLCGLTGMYWPGVTGSMQRILAAGQGLLGIFLIIYGISGLKIIRNLWCGHSLWPERPSFFITGFLTGINICPPFLVAITAALALGDFAGGIVFFIFFFLGTSLFILPLALLRHLARRDEVRIAARIAAVFFGMWFLWRAVRFYL